MHAVVEIKGKQFLVTPGSRIKVATLAEEAGKDIIFESVILASDKDVLSDKKTTVTAHVVSHGLGKKIRVFKHHAKKRYRRTQGHRQAYTELQITDVKAGK